MAADGEAGGRQHVSMGLAWSGINFSVPKADSGTKHILTDVSGSAAPGELLAIMGPSGAGKTSLLNALARHNPMATGEILLNDKPWQESFNTLMAYMHQDEMFMPDLTVREHLQFQAKCRLPAMDDAQRNGLIENAIVQMGLERQSDQPIGDAVAGGPHISKNERKRLNYATEILTQPSLLLVDEPTTGLDSFMAEIVVNDLKKLATGEVKIGDAVDQKRTVIATIHQPSSDVFRLFDKLCLLGACLRPYQPLAPQSTATSPPDMCGPPQSMARSSSLGPAARLRHTFRSWAKPPQRPRCGPARTTPTRPTSSCGSSSTPRTTTTLPSGASTPRRSTPSQSARRAAAAGAGKRWLRRAPSPSTAHSWRRSGCCFGERSCSACAQPSPSRPRSVG